MKIAHLVQLAGASALIVRQREFICPNADPTDCYPAVFEPTSEWQPIREGQHIPPGLHVRLNMATNEREAKLDEPGDSPKAEIEAVEPETDVSLVDFSSDSKTRELLENLIELSHDIKHGVQFTHDRSIFRALQKLAANEEYAEKAYRIMGACLRNNPEAVRNVLEKQPGSFLEHLFSVLRNRSTPEVIQKRVLGILQGLAADVSFRHDFFSPDGQKLHGFEQLVAVYPAVGPLAQERIVNILEDLLLLKRDATPHDAMSTMLQKRLVGCKSEVQTQIMFKTLAKIHEGHVSKEFMHWLSEQSEARKGDDTDFSLYLVDARHQIFGNPNAHRKGMEL